MIDNIMLSKSKLLTKLYSIISNSNCPSNNHKTQSPVMTYPMVKLYHWKPANGSLNFGDQLSDVVVRKMLANSNRSLDEEVSIERNLFAIGSVLHFARDGDCVWGSGWNGKVDEALFKPKSLEVHAVRGPLTAEFLRKRGIHVPDVYGDPALLVPYLFPGKFNKSTSSPKPYIVVPNLNELDLVHSLPNVISPLRGWNHVISSIVNSELVISSSLHGLIMAEAFGVPAVYLRLSERESLFKYKDYHLGTGRTEASFKYAIRIEEAIEMRGDAMVYNPDDLLKAFPFHLWN